MVPCSDQGRGCRQGCMLMGKPASLRSHLCPRSSMLEKGFGQGAIDIWRILHGVGSMPGFLLARGWDYPWWSCLQATFWRWGWEGKPVTTLEKIGSPKSKDEGTRLPSCRINHLLNDQEFQKLIPSQNGSRISPSCSGDVTLTLTNLRKRKRSKPCAPLREWCSGFRWVLEPRIRNLDTGSLLFVENQKASK